MKRHLWILAGVIFLAGTGATWALQGKSDETKALNAALKSWETAFNRHDAEALGKLYAKDADAIDFYGETQKGRAAIAKGYAEMFQEPEHQDQANTRVTTIPHSKNRRRKWQVG